MGSLRKRHSGAFKSKVVIAALKNNKTINEIGNVYGVHPNQISNWKKIALDGLPSILSDKRSQKERGLEKENKILKDKVVEQMMEFEWLKKKMEI